MTEKQGPVRLAIVGTGAIARKHVEAIAVNRNEVELVAVCDIDSEAARRLAPELDSSSVFTSLDDLLDSGRIDAAIIATPHFLHYEQALACVEAGIPALVEKPLVTRLDHLIRLKQAADSANTLVVAGQMQRFDRTNVLARRWMDADQNRFGELASFSLRSWQDITEYTAQIGLGHWLLNGELAGGGVVVSLGVHQLDLMRYLSGADYAQVSARGTFSEPFHSGAEASASVLVTMSNGASGTIHASYNAPRAFASESYSLFGTHGGLSRDFRPVGDYMGTLLYSSAHATDIVDFSSEGQNPSSHEFDLVSDLGESNFANQLAHFARAIRGSAEPRNTITDNFNTVACIDAINQSVREGGAPVDVSRY